MAITPSSLVELPGQLSGYKLLERLGRGGFGEVWKVEAPGGFMKAMKFVFGDLDATEDEGRAAEQELKALHRVKTIRHPYILSLERFDIIDGQLIIVMELADRNLWDRFRECRVKGLQGIPREELLRYMMESAEALDLMNTHYQIQHLDIKPQNIFLVFEHVKVADFGLAKAFEGAKATVTGGVTPVYAAPETFEGYVSRYSDQYSLAIVYQELLTGCRPFNGANTKQLLLQHLRDAPDVSSLPPNDRDIIRRAMSKKPNERWPTCLEMIKRLAAATEGASTGYEDHGALPLPSGTGTPMPRGTVAAAPASSSVRKPAHTEQRTVNNVPAVSQWSRPGDYTSTTMQAPPSMRDTRLPGTTQLPKHNLVTPRLVTQKALSANAPAMTLQRDQIVETGRIGALGMAPPEKTGDGILMPALIVGVGHTGKVMLQRFRELVRSRYPESESTAHIRYLYIDTDFEEINNATNGEDALSPNEVLVTRLHRPAHYLQREDLPPLDSWFPPGLLYRLPKAPTSTGGTRAFGRLALCDNYQPIIMRVRQEIETLMAESTIDRAARKSGLGMRSNQARVYLLAGTAGGTGGGMLVDLAYCLKHELFQVGYRKPEVVGMLLAPPIDKSVPRLAQANTFATLAEICHFSSGQSYHGKFEKNNPPITSSHSVFDRLVVMSLNSKKDSKSEEEVTGAIARSLFLDLFTPLGKSADYVRSVCPSDPYSGATFQPFGLYRLSWPRHEILEALTQRFGAQVLRRWTTRETAHLREPIKRWLDDQWLKLQLEPKAIQSCFEEIVKSSLRETPEVVFHAAVNTLKQAGGNKMDASAVVQVLDQLVKMVGRPKSGENDEVTSSISTVIEESTRSITGDFEKHISEIAVSFIEQPQYRLAGADEALNQITEKLRKVVELHEAELKDIRHEAAQTFSKLAQHIGGRFGTTEAMMNRKIPVTPELLEMLLRFARKQYKGMLLNALLTVHRTVIACMPDFMRDVQHCRAKLEGYTAKLAARAKAKLPNEPHVLIMPLGCENLDSAADQFIAGLPPEDILQFDNEFQDAINQKYQGLVRVCLKDDSGNRFPILLLKMSRDFIDPRLDHSNAAQALLQYRGDGNECLDSLTDAYDKALPNVLIADNIKPLEATLLATPKGEDGNNVRKLAVSANPGVEFIPVTLEDDIIFYREWPRSSLASLQQLDDAARTAYQSQLTSEHPPIARTDIEWLVPRRIASN